MTIIMVVIAGAAAHFRGLRFNHGNDLVVRETLAFDAVIVDHIPKPVFRHKHCDYIR